MRVFKLLKPLFNEDVGKQYVSSDGYIRIGNQWSGYNIPDFICLRNTEWFKEVTTNVIGSSPIVTIKVDEKMEGLESIKKHLENIKEAHDWCRDNFPDILTGQGDAKEGEKRIFLYTKLLPAIEKEINALEGLGVSKGFSFALFYLGGLVTQELVKQFKNYPT